jgi:parallel beta-helix repeat protein
LCIVLFSWAWPVLALELNRDTLWQGELVFSEPVRVAEGVTLTIAPGATIRFTRAGLDVAGALVANDAQIGGDDWDGVVLKNCDAATRLNGLKINGAATGVLVQGGGPHMDNLLLQDNTVGIELRGRAQGAILNSRFVENRKVGLFVKDESTSRVSHCLFRGNGRFGAYVYRARPDQFDNNRFVDNPTGLMIAYHGTDPLIARNRFEQNDIGIQVDRAAKPVLRDNLIRDNQTGIRLYRRSDPLIEGNYLGNNQVAILIGYSSYPVIQRNDFSGNALAIRLEYQSSSWERAKGEAAREGEVKARSAFGGQGMRSVTEDQRRALQLDGVVGAPNNWWGEAETRALQGRKEQDNPSFLHDGRDQATFEEAGQQYPLDRIEFRPWSRRPVTELTP